MLILAYVSCLCKNAKTDPDGLYQRAIEKILHKYCLFVLFLRCALFTVYYAYFPRLMPTTERKYEKFVENHVCWKKCRMTSTLEGRERSMFKVMKPNEKVVTIKICLKMFWKFHDNTTMCDHAGHGLVQMSLEGLF
jgi:hypothetical protein